MRFALPLILLASAVHAETVRFAVVVGNNAGSGRFPSLRYAENDAGKFARVMVEIGDVEPEHLQLLQGRSEGELEAALLRAREQIAQVKRLPENRAVLIFYFSGHSDGEALEVGKEQLLYSRLKNLMAGVGDVRLTVIDACQSAAAFRQKGAKLAEPFAIKITETLNSTGDAFIASSAESESSLESAEVMGSIFTHHFVSGLRGVADTSGDGLVTLGEAYRYAHDQTVARTASMPVGMQHPSYDYKLSGQGELILATLQKASSQLGLPPGAERAVITDVLRDQVIAEIPTAATRAVALPPGTYGLRMYRSGQSYGGRVTLLDGARHDVSWSELELVSSGTAVARKGAIIAQAIEDSAVWPDDRFVEVAVGVAPSIALPIVAPSIRLGFEPRLGPGLSFAVNGTYGSKGTVWEGVMDVRVGWRWSWRFGPVWLGLGAELGPAFFLQGTGSTTLFSLGGIATPRLGLRTFLGSTVILSLEGEAGVALFSADGGLQAAFRPGGTLGIGFRF